MTGKAGKREAAIGVEAVGGVVVGPQGLAVTQPQNLRPARREVARRALPDVKSQRL
jgi:hypothetical protein